MIEVNATRTGIKKYVIIVVQTFYPWLKYDKVLTTMMKNSIWEFIT